MIPFAPAVPAAPLYTIGMEMVLLTGESKLLPLTVNVTVTPVELDVGVTTTEDEVADVGVAPDIAHEYVGEFMFDKSALNVAVVGVYAPPAF